MRGKRCFSHVLACGLSIPTTKKVKKCHVGHIFRHLIMASTVNLHYGIRSLEVVFWPRVTFETMRIRMGLVELAIFATSLWNNSLWLLNQIFVFPVFRAHVKGGLFPEVHLGATPRRPQTPPLLVANLTVIIPSIIII